MPRMIMIVIAIIFGLFMMAPMGMCGLLAAIILPAVIMGSGARK